MHWPVHRLGEEIEGAMACAVALAWEGDYRYISLGRRLEVKLPVHPGEATTGYIGLGTRLQVHWPVWHT